jgi:hypothetical protein
MKSLIRNIALLAIACVMIVGCKKDTPEDNTPPQTIIVYMAGVDLSSFFNINRNAIKSALNFNIQGKSIYKDEFVTAGGINLKEVDFKTMQSKLLPHLYFAGEVLNIDAITGGFNFQNAWTGGYIAAAAMSAL